MRRTRWTALLMFLAYLPACTSYVAMPDPVTSLPATSKLRVTLQTGERLVLDSATVSGDTLRGIDSKGVAVRVPMSEVDQVAQHRVSTPRTIGLVAAGVLVGAVATFAVLVFPLD